MKHITRERAARLDWAAGHLWSLTEKQQTGLAAYHAWRGRRYRWTARAVVVAAVIGAVVTMGLAR